MPEWKLKYYQGREIKTVDDLIWVCATLHEAQKTGQMSWAEIGALSYVEKLLSEKVEVEEVAEESIKNRFELLDL